MAAKEEIELALKLFADVGREFLADRELSNLLAEYRDSISKTNELMRNTCVARMCASCAAGPAQSCCFKSAEEWYGRVLLLVNLLMGADLSTEPEIAEGCLFVGRKGCSLTARYSFCINYLCPEINAMLGPDVAAGFLSMAGLELGLGWRVEKRVIRMLEELG